MSDDSQTLWDRLLSSAMAYHGTSKVYGMQRIIAEDSGASMQAVSKWSKQQSSPKEDTLKKLSELYEVPLEWLVGRNFEKPSGDLLERAVNLTSTLTLTLIPDGSPQECMDVLQRVSQLLREGATDTEIRGRLFQELTE